MMCTVVTWGDKAYGGDSSTVKTKLRGVETIYSTRSAFAALLKDGTVVTWGDSNEGRLFQYGKDQIEGC